MKILFYRYGNICEPDIINCFQQLNITVIEETIEITNKKVTASQRVALLNQAILKHHPLFVFSINFFPSIAEICHIHKTFYLCWTVDSPVLELFSKSIQHDTNRIFLFDQAQYERFSPYNLTCIHHLPLAAATGRFDNVIKTITPQERNKHSHDITFIGSLYTEKNPLHKLKLPAYVDGYINGATETSLKIYGYNFTEQLMNEQIVNALKAADSSFYHNSDTVEPTDYYTAAHSYVGLQIAETERIRTLNELAKYFQVDLYTRSNTSSLQNVNVHGGVKTLTEMPKIFHLSKINLNMTIKPIQTGLPLRIFDIMGCGGFLMTNYQAEITDYFTIGTDLETYSSLEELIDKCAFYLEHDDIRQKIALNGYNQVSTYHTYQNRITEMLKRITQGL